ncbi:GNAT family N-acetyltransferase [Novosphingobium sp. ZW T3_23]|uniref:GNAT family N-acetyltransferase n=1 Tax=Novosphingobium sp. ZW T3_23 TaxID=3378084 RepID=UPI0038549586
MFDPEAHSVREETASAAVSLRCVPWRTLETEVRAWDRLAVDASEPNPFFESWYLLPSLRRLLHSEAVMILRFEMDGRLAGLMPILRSPRYYRWPVPNLASWLHDNCFCGAPLVRRGAEDLFWRAVLDWADKTAGKALFLHLRAIPLEGPLHATLSQVLARQRRECEVVLREDRALLASSLAPDAYLEASLSGKKRKELRRQASRLAEIGTLAVERREDADGLGAWCDAFLALEASGWKGKAGSALANHAATGNLFRESLHGAAERGRLERLSLTLDGRPIAMLASFLTPPGAFSFKTAFDESYSRFSPGVLLQRENLRILERADIRWTDSCAAADHPMIDHIWRERRAMARLSIAIGGPIRRRLFRHFVRAEIARSPAGGNS